MSQQSAFYPLIKNNSSTVQQPDNKETITQKILKAGVKEGDRIAVYVYHAMAYDQQLLTDVRMIIHEIFDDFRFVDIEIIGHPLYIKMEDEEHYDGEVRVAVVRRRQEDDINYR